MSADPVLYYNQYSCPSRKVLMALYEKRVEFVKEHLDLMAGDQLKTSYLRSINPRGEVPVLKHGQSVVPESSRILEYIDKHLGRPYLLYPVEKKDKIQALIAKIDAIPMFILTYGTVCFQLENGVTELLRHPYCNYDRDKMRMMMMSRPATLKSIANQYKGEEIERIFNDKADKLIEALNIMTNKQVFDKFLQSIDVVLDEVEDILAADDRPGPWLFGQTFSAADICLTALLVRLHQLGMDDRYWKEGIRPHLSVYQELAFRRPSVEKATSVGAKSSEFIHITNDGRDSGALSPVGAAQVGLGAVLVLGGIYACKKLLRK